MVVVAPAFASCGAARALCASAYALKGSRHPCIGDVCVMFYLQRDAARQTSWRQQAIGNQPPPAPSASRASCRLTRQPLPPSSPLVPGYSSPLSREGGALTHDVGAPRATRRARGASTGVKWPASRDVACR